MWHLAQGVVKCARLHAISQSGTPTQSAHICNQEAMVSSLQRFLWFATTILGLEQEV